MYKILFIKPIIIDIVMCGNLRAANANSNNVYLLIINLLFTNSAAYSVCIGHTVAKVSID